MDPITVAFGLAQFAPQILKWLTGSDKAADAAATVVDIAKKVTGRDDDVVAALKADPALALKFRQAVMDNEADLDKAYLADRQDARKRDVQLAQAGVTNSRANAMVAMDVIGLLFGLGGMLLLGYYKAKYPEAISEGVFGALLAQLSTITSYFGLCLRDAHQFEFGSSRGSRIKDDIAAQQSQAAK